MIIVTLFIKIMIIIVKIMTIDQLHLDYADNQVKIWEYGKNRNLALITFDPRHHFSHHHFDYNAIQIWKLDI